MDIDGRRVLFLSGCGDGKKKITAPASGGTIACPAPKRLPLVRCRLERPAWLLDKCSRAGIPSMLGDGIRHQQSRRADCLMVTAAVCVENVIPYTGLAGQYGQWAVSAGSSTNVI